MVTVVFRTMDEAIEWLLANKVKIERVSENDNVIYPIKLTYSQE